ncbi:AEC family transporter [Vibrio sp. Isolate31]|uniref:AEC family transporter n=1 Tax=unclassified Vibrio TaxID=2614977 RepID=UPI001EFD1A03|nr:MULTISPECIES: AEC family transporter [unclassified Vibrio]MCG9554771.1 AEC family transporter [Vibrio sp. Isolate32]MCG9601011.1 AEC family transporter [Vibrio sp. Isolate31]
MLPLTHFHHVISTILPVFFVIGLGYIATKWRVIPENSHKSFAAFVFNFGLPAAIFSALSTKSLSEIWNVNYIVVYTVGSLSTFFLIAIASLAVLRKSATESVILGLGSSFSNSLLIGFPIIYFLFGSQALVPFSLTLVVENLIMLPLLLTLADMTHANANKSLKQKATETLVGLSRNPIVLSIVLGMLASAMEVSVPETIARMIVLLANTVTGVALFTIGAGLVGVRSKGMKKEIGIVMLGKLLLHPLLLLVMIMLWFDLEPIMAAVAIILASMPMFGVYTVIGQKYNMGGLCSAVLLPTTLVAMVTISLVTTGTIMIFGLN